MENRNFHTSLLGGFRKKDVVSFLAEEKSRQDSALQDLQQQLDEAEGQLQRLMEERDRALEQAQELRQQLQDVRDGQEELEERLNDAALREQAMASQSAQSQAEYLQAMEENRRLEDRLEAAEARVRELEARPEPCVPAVDMAELDGLREQLLAEQQKTRELAALLQQPQSRSCAGESMDQLWSLCGKMERTLGQMERMLDGPYRMTCYPEPPADRPQAEYVSAPEEPLPAEPAPAAPTVQQPSVKTLLQRIRKR